MTCNTRKVTAGICCWLCLWKPNKTVLLYSDKKIKKTIRKNLVYSISHWIFSKVLQSLVCWLFSFLRQFLWFFWKRRDTKKRLKGVCWSATRTVVRALFANPACNLKLLTVTIKIKISCVQILFALWLSSLNVHYKSVALHAETIG